MSTPINPSKVQPSKDAEIEEIQQDIAETRKELGDTVEALSAKLDVKGRAKEKATSLKDQALTRLSSSKEHATRAVTSGRTQLERLARQAREYQAENSRQRQALISGACAAAAALMTIMIWRSARGRTRA